MFAIIETGGKQYKVAEGDILNVEKLPKTDEGGDIAFDKVLLINNDKGTQVGNPYIAGANVMANFIEEGRDKKVVIIKYKAKVRYHVKNGHRQPYTKIKIAKIG